MLKYKVYDSKVVIVEDSQIEQEKKDTELVSVTTLIEKVLVKLDSIQRGNQRSRSRGNECFRSGWTGH